MDEQVLMLSHSSRSDLDLISPYNITPKSNINNNNNINQISDEKKEKYNITCIVIQVILN